MYLSKRLNVALFVIFFKSADSHSHTVVCVLESVSILGICWIFEVVVFVSIKMWPKTETTVVQLLTVIIKYIHISGPLNDTRHKWLVDQHDYFLV